MNLSCFLLMDWFDKCQSKWLVMSVDLSDFERGGSYGETGDEKRRRKEKYGEMIIVHISL